MAFAIKTVKVQAPGKPGYAIINETDFQAAKGKLKLFAEPKAPEAKASEDAE